VDDAHCYVDLEWQRLPDALLAPHRFRRIAVGAWKDDGHIHDKEGRIPLDGSRRSAGKTQHHDKRLLSIGDNMSEVLSFDGGLTKCHQLNALRRVAAANRIAAAITWTRRHVESVRNPSDADSRLPDAGLLRPGQRFCGDHDAAVLGKQAAAPRNL
jgi:hypothetical protein